MDEWMDGWKDGLIDGDRLINGKMYEWIDMCKRIQMNKFLKIEYTEE